MSRTEHNHVFQIKHPKTAGECYSCDRILALSASARIHQLEDLILFIEELAETQNSQAALRHLTAFIQMENLRERHKL